MGRGALPRGLMSKASAWTVHTRWPCLNRRPKPAPTQPAKGKGTFKAYDLGFVHIDIKHLPKLQTADGERRKRYLYVAIDRRSRAVHLAVKDDETEASAIAFLREAAAALPFRMTHVLTDNGSCFTQAFAKVCAELGAEYRHIKPRTPQTNGMVERFNGRIVAEVLAITVYSHAQLEQLLRRLYGKKSEELDPDDLFLLAREILEGDGVEAETTPELRRPRLPKGRPRVTAASPCRRACRAERSCTTSPPKRGLAPIAARSVDPSAGRSASNSNTSPRR